MHSDCLPFSQIPHSTRLFTDFLSYSGKAPQFYPRSPYLSEWVAQESEHISYDAERRERVAAILEEQNQRFGSGSKTQENLRKFRAGAAAAVTGQQVGLLGGPLFALLKALTAVRMAEQAENAGVPCVPVFWLATEDHDLDEVNHTSVPGSDGSLAILRCEAKGMDSAPVGDMVFGAEIEQLVQQALELLGPSEASDAVQNAYRAGETMGSSFAKLLANIFSDWGVILMDGYDPAFHRIAEPIYLAAAEQAAELDDLLLERGHQLEQAGYHQQVKVTQSSTLLFEIKGGQRTVVQRSNGDFKVGSERCSREDLLKRIAEHPEKFSANVLLRPIMQDFLLPTLAYAGGPAEVAYFAQVAVVYERLLGRVTPVLARFSATVVGPKQQKLLNKYGLKLQDTFHGPEKLREIMAQRVLPSSLKASFEEAASNVKASMDRIRENLQQLDPTLVEAAHHAEAKMQYQLDRLQGRAARAELGRNEIIDNHARMLSSHLCPHKTLQERELAGVYFLAQYGMELLNTLYEAARHDCPDHQVLYL